MSRYLFRNLDNPLVQELGLAGQAALKQRSAMHDETHGDFDFNTLANTISDNFEDGWWYITLERFAYVDSEGNYIKMEDAPAVPGAKAKFLLNCEHGSVIRMMEECTGVPDSNTLLRYVWLQTYSAETKTPNHN